DAGWTRHAVAALAALPGQAIPFLQKHVQPIAPADVKLARLLADLDSDKFVVRERATNDLEKLDVDAEAGLRTTLKSPRSLEMNRRVEGLLKKLDTAPDALRKLRAIEVLEQNGTAEA